MKITEKWTEIAYSNVKINDRYLRNAYSKEILYLKSLQPERLLRGFYDVAGIQSDAPKYPGWEVTEIAGHTLGHYLTALAQIYAGDRDLDILARIEFCITELGKCQLKDGYLFASDMEIFDRVEQHKPAWVPWYTMHKIFEGLLSAYRLAGNQNALEIARKLGNWVFHRVSCWSTETRDTVLSVEYGGMNDCLYELYEYTGHETILFAAHQFDEIPLFREIYQKKDVLNGLHANTTIPKIIGALNRYRNTGEEWYLNVAENFWDMVVSHHTYITGGNSEWEHFGRPDILDAERTACNCETCNTYNMLKLSKMLFEILDHEKYMDFYERTFQNAILSSQNPESGMTMYFQPMATGYFKTFGEPYDKFWCCTGTGMENFTKLSEAIYFRQDRVLGIERLVTSEVILEDLGVCVEIVSEIPSDSGVMLRIHGRLPQDFQIRIRIPEWAHDGIHITRGNQSRLVRGAGGSLVIENLIDQEAIFLEIPMRVLAHSLPDHPATVAFSYGPVVLCGLMGNSMMNTSVTGVDVTVARKEIFMKDYLVIEDNASDWIEQIERHLKKIPQEMTFVLHGTDEDDKLKFVPYFSQYQQRYGIYYRIYQKGSGELLHSRELEERRHRVEKEAIDIIPVGNDQYELAHHIRGERTDFCIKNGHRCRFLVEQGYVSYELHIERSTDLLCVTYYEEEMENIPEITGDGFVLENKGEISRTEDGFLTCQYGFPAEISEGNNTVHVMFQNKSATKTCRIYDQVYIRKTGEETEEKK